MPYIDEKGNSAPGKTGWDHAWLLSRVFAGLLLSTACVLGTLALAMLVFFHFYLMDMRAAALLATLATVVSGMSGHSWARAQFFAHMLPEVVAEMRKENNG